MKLKLRKDGFLKQHNMLLGTRLKEPETDHLYIFLAPTIIVLKQKKETPSMGKLLESREPMCNMGKVTYKIINKENVYTSKCSMKTGEEKG